MSNLLIYKTKLNNAPSNQIAYIDRSGSLHHCENGYVDKYPLLSDTVTPKTRFRYASVTKLWTSDTILDLVKQDKVNLDNTLAQYFSEIDNPVDERVANITIRQLLKHQGGFVRTSILGSSTNMFKGSDPMCPNHLNDMNTIELGFTPGEDVGYSNFGYCLLGEIIARVENKPYTQVIADRYQLADTAIKFISTSKLEDEVFVNYVETGLTGLGDIYQVFDYDALASSAGLSGNAIELALQVAAMTNKSSPNILAFDNGLNCDMTQINGCYGYAMTPYQPVEGQQTLYFRDGALPGLSTLVAVGEDNQVVALLSNGAPKGGEQNTAYIKTLIYEHLGAQ